MAHGRVKGTFSGPFLREATGPFGCSYTPRSARASVTPQRRARRARPTRRLTAARGRDGWPSRPRGLVAVLWPTDARQRRRTIGDDRDTMLFAPGDYGIFDGPLPEVIEDLVADRTGPTGDSPDLFEIGRIEITHAPRQDLALFFHPLEDWLTRKGEAPRAPGPRGGSTRTSGGSRRSSTRAGSPPMAPEEGRTASFRVAALGIACRKLDVRFGRAAWGFGTWTRRHGGEMKTLLVIAFPRPPHRIRHYRRRSRRTRVRLPEQGSELFYEPAAPGAFSARRRPTGILRVPCR
jgi:hypothetical protein